MVKPLLSVIIPNYNHAHYLPETLDSVLAQDFDDFELIVGDDCSTDDSISVIKAYGSRIRPFFFQKNRGVIEMCKILTKEAKGKYVHLFSSDDLYFPHFLSASMQCMLENNLKLTCTDIQYFGGDKTRETKLYKEGCVLTKKIVVEHFRKTNFWVPGVSCIVKRDLLSKYGMHRKELENISDWFLFHHIALFEGIGYIPQVGIGMREQPSSYTQTVKKDRKRRNATYFAVLGIVAQDKEIRKKFRDSTVLTFIFENLFWKLLFRPIWWDFFWCSKMSTWKRIKSSFAKRLKTHAPS